MLTRIESACSMQKFTCGETLNGRDGACDKCTKVGMHHISSRELEQDLKVIKAIHLELVPGGGAYRMGWKIAHINRWRCEEIHSSL
jgi:hypothetical protein